MSEIRRRRQTQEAAGNQPALPMMTSGMPLRQGLPMGGGMPMPGGMPAGGGMPEGGMQEKEIPAESPVRTAEEEAAYQLGSRMGAESVASALTAGTAAADEPKRGMTRERLIEAERLLMEYKKGKASVDRRIINAQQWWKLLNWEQIENQRGTQGATEIKSATGWLWNSIVGKHADAMDSYPEPVILPRMEEDKDEAEILSDIIPVILSMNKFEKEYSNAQWQKFQEGTGGFYVGWDKTKMGGMGDIAIRNISLLNLFWEPGIENIQESKNLFYVSIVNTEDLEEQYPQLKGKLKNAYLKPAEYRKDDSVSVDGKSVLVDWYYHSWKGPRKILHYCQFVNEEIIYSTEERGEDGLYDDGEYPFVLDPLYPVKGSPAGYGLIDIAMDCQTDIDTINQAMVLNAVVTSTPRYFSMTDGAINEEEFADWRKPIVHCRGGLGENSLRQIVTQGIQGNALQMYQNKIDELKYITGNTDVQNGGTPSGVTAASAIAALQEMSGRSSKDSTRSSYWASSDLYSMVIERLRQFYDMPRWFRILGPNGQEKFIQYTNARLQEQQITGGLGMEPGFRKPVFDIDVRTERETAYTKLSQNELAIQLMQLGVFNPQMTDQSLMMLDMMDFRGKDELMRKVENMGTLQEALMKVGQIALMLSQKYDPAIAAQLAPVLQGIGMDAGAIPGEVATGLPEPDAIGKPSEENSIVRKAKQRVQDSTRPT